MYYGIYIDTVLDGERRMFYTPNHYRALVVYDKLKERGYKIVYIRKFTVSEQIDLILQMRQNRNTSVSYNGIKFLLENTEQCMQ